MPRGVRKEKVYTGKAAKAYEKVQKLEADLKVAKEELKVAYKEQQKLEKESAAKEKKETQAMLLKVIKESGKTPEEIMELLKQ